MDILMRFIRDVICDESNRVQGSAGQLLNHYSRLPNADQYYTPVPQPTWFPEAALQSTLYGLIQQQVAAMHYNSIVLAEQPYPNDPEGRRSDIMVVDTNSGNRLGIEVKADFILDNAVKDMDKLEIMLVEGIIYTGMSIFACLPDNVERWKAAVSNNRPEALVAAAVARRD